jgi:hypothetical protein
MAHAIALPAVEVQYYRRMRPRRVYPVIVRWAQPPQPGTGGIRLVTLRLQAGGAQVVPAEATLDTAHADGEAAFYVTPLTDGWLRGQHLELHVKGQKVQELLMSSRVVSRRSTCIFLFLAVALPLLLAAIRSSDGDWLHRVIATHVPPVAESVKQTLPASEGWWNGAWNWLGDRYVDLHQWTVDRYLAFTAFVVCLLLALWSALRHRERRVARAGKPVTVVAPDE